jgi:hypothetical protein
MIYATYNPSKKGDNIIGFYSIEHNNVPKPNVIINKNQRDQIITYPGHFRVENNELIEIKDVGIEIKRRSLKYKQPKIKETLAPLEIDNFIYFTDSSFLSNLNLNLNLCSLMSEHTCFFWRYSKDVKAWTFSKLNKQDLVDVAEAFNKRREQKSRSFYGLLPE